MNQNIQHKIEQYKKMAKSHEGKTIATRAASTGTDGLSQVIRSKKDADDFMAELNAAIQRSYPAPI